MTASHIQARRTGQQVALRRAALAIVTLLASTSLTLLAAAPARAVDAFNTHMLSLINGSRTAAGVAPVSAHTGYGSVAENGLYLGCGYPVSGRAFDMGVRDYNSATILDCAGKTARDMATAAGLPFASMSEVIGWSNGRTDAAQAATYVHKTWMADPALKAQLLQPNITHAGIGSWYSGIKKWQGLGKVYLSSLMLVELGPSVGASPAAVSFASQNVNTTSAPSPLTLTSTGSVSALITTMTATAPFSVVNNTCIGLLLVLGLSCTSGVTFAPTTADTYQGTLTITTNGGTQTLPLSGTGASNGAAVSSLSTTSLYFGEQEVGYASGSQVVTLTNGGQGLLTVDEVTVSGPFEIRMNGCDGTTRKPGLTCKVSAVFTPAAAGAASGALTFSTNAGVRTVSLTGTGAASTRAQVTIPGSIAADCSVNVTTAIQAWIDATPDSSVLHFGTNGCYRVDGTIELRLRNRLTFDGHGSTFKAVTNGSEAVDPRIRSQWKFIGGSRIVMRDMTTVGANPAGGVGDTAYVAMYEAQHNYEFQGTANVVLENVQGTDPYGDFVYIGPRQGTPAKDVTVRDSHFERNGRQGIAVTSGEDILIERSYIGAVRRSLLDIEANYGTDVIRRITFRNNEVGRFRLNFLANGGARTAPHDDVHIIGNTITGWATSLLSNIQAKDGLTRTGYKFIDNTSTQEYGSPAEGVIVVSNVNDLEVRGNTQPMQVSRNMKLVRITQTANVSVTDNTIVRATGSINFGGGANTDYCANGNLIRNMVLETTTYPCG